MKNKVLFLTLRIFSATGGIEKVCRIAGKALYELGLQYGGRVKIHSMYGLKDNADGNKYFPQSLFTGFGGRKIRYIFKSIREGRKSRVVILSHANLLLPGGLIKFFKPSVKLVLLAHGIEVWRPFSAWKRYMLSKCDLVLPVSHFTKEKMKSLYNLPEERFSVLNNCVDPFLELPLQKEKNERLLTRYGLNAEHPILLTVSRMSATERAKGYDKVLESLPELMKIFPLLRYLVVGRYDVEEKLRLDNTIKELGLQDIVVFTGFITDKELAAHFNLADIFVMPSEKEGFGIVFIEAMFYGKPVIAGNMDGSEDALCNGEMGLLVDPENKNELVMAIKNMLENKAAYIPDQKKLIGHFGYTGYKEKLHEMINVF